MDMHHPIPDREIGDEEEVLEELWSYIPELPPDEAGDKRGYTDLQGRIAGRLRLRRRFRLICAGGMAAAILIGYLLWQPVERLESGSVYAQLEDLGVRVSNDRIVLKADGGVVMALDSAARIEQRSESDISLTTSSGEALALAGKRRLKVEVPAGCRFQLTLSDGTEVWLNAGSSLEYPVTFAGIPERRVRLEGEAF